MTSKTIYCVFLAFITTLTIFAGCASNLNTNSAILLNANVTKTYDQFEKQNRIIYYEYVYEFGNNTYVGANSKLFNSMHLSEAVHFSNLTIVPIYVCANDVEKSQFHLYKCSRGLIDFLLIVGTVFGLLTSMIIALAFFSLICVKNQFENTALDMQIVKHQRRRSRSSRSKKLD